MENKNVNFIDAEESSGGFIQGLSFREIVLNYVKVIGTLSKVEMRGGYYQERLGSNGQVAGRIYVEDTRKQYVNAVRYLADLLFPHFDERMKKFLADKEESYDKKHIKAINLAENGSNFDSIKDELRYFELKVYRKIFREINVFLHQTNYLEAKIYEDEA